MSLHRIDLPQKRCPGCREPGGLHFVNVLVAKDVGDFSLAGQQLKFSVIERAVMRCQHCDFEKVGHLENVELSEDGATFLGGHFVEDRRSRDA